MQLNISNVVSLSAKDRLGGDLAELLGLQHKVAEFEVFEDGEKLCTSTGLSNCLVVMDYHPSKNANLMDLVQLCSAINGSVAVLLPLLPHSRSEAWEINRLLSILKTVGVDEVLSFDLHDESVIDELSLPVITISSDKLWAKKLDPNSGELIIVSPDRGGSLRALKLAKRIGTSSVSLNKERSDSGVTIDSDIDFTDKTVIIFDDIVATGQTMSAARKLMLEKGAAEVRMLATNVIATKSQLKSLGIESVQRLSSKDQAQLAYEFIVSRR